MSKKAFGVGFRACSGFLLCLSRTGESGSSEKTEIFVPFGVLLYVMYILGESGSSVDGGTSNPKK
jgi:hypothetical protein